MTDQHKPSDNGTEPEKVGIYICHCGGNISDHVDVDAVREKVGKLSGVSVARTNMFMCSDPGQEMIMEDLKNGRVNRVVVASCAPSLHETTFRNALIRSGVNPYVYEHANIREQVSWVHHGDAATEKATRLVSAAAAKAGLLKPLEPIRVDAGAYATVIGGGIAGLRAAKDLADAGIRVTLIEKSPFLGGQLVRLNRVAPSGEAAADLIKELAGQVLAHPAITVHTCTEVETFEGYVGNFKLGLKKAPPDLSETETGHGLDECAPGDWVPFAGVFPAPVPEAEAHLVIDAGVIVLATGFAAYAPRQGEYGFGDYKEVITLPDLIRILAEAPTKSDRLVVNGREIKSLAMIHCVGSRQIPGIHPEDESGHLNEYCSRTCCTATLNAANIVRETYPGTTVYEFYRDIRTYGRGQEELYDQASRNRVVFLRFEADEAPEVVPFAHSDAYPLQVKVKDTLTFGEEIDVPADLVVLAVGMEPADISGLIEMMKLPVGMDRFLLEVHPKLRPVELPVGGVLLAGTCQAPMDVGEACNGAGGAAAKAVALLKKGYVELDPFVAEVDPAKCTGTGACVAVCPENAIEVSGWTLKQYEAMVDRIVADPLPAE